MDFVQNLRYIRLMNISLPREQLEWLEAEVAAGHFSSIDEAITVAVAELRTLHEDDLAWAKPYVEEARASVARGDVISGEEFFKHLDEKIDSLRSK
jgi:Arc/MetJ-type ribon-helix-helix transcriptional regulator